MKVPGRSSPRALVYWTAAVCRPRRRRADMDRECCDVTALIALPCLGTERTAVKPKGERVSEKQRVGQKLHCQYQVTYTRSQALTHTGSCFENKTLFTKEPGKIFS